MSYSDEGYFHEPWGPEYVQPAPADCPGCGCCTARLCKQAKNVSGFTQPDLAGATGIPCEYLVDNRDREAVDQVRGCPCTAGMPRKPEPAAE
ncbi:hypothetical protein [Kitasatospora sp. NPDC001175]|uniref:hypothetical protein n=1 Tax=Kitasatospora sp. NPDC001175 TaxID=3157103 RepID=UPI003D0313D3